MLFSTTRSATPTIPFRSGGQAPRVLDLSRSFSRFDRPVATGIDRVERAYWREFSARRGDVWALIRTGRRFALLDHQQSDQMMRNICSGALGPRAMRIAKHLLPGRAAGRVGAAWLRRKASYFGCMAGLKEDLKVRMPHGFDYFNVGHCNLADALLTELRRAGAGNITVMLHDMIPLDYPELARRGTQARFLARSTSALTHADKIVCNSRYTAGRVRHYAKTLSARPDMKVAHLGVDLPCPDALSKPKNVPDAPYFLCVGTIEPRKNHSLLFEVWQKLIAGEPQGSPPRLVLAGGRGWNNRAVFEFLDSSPLSGSVIEERGAVSDAELFALMSGAKALLFPSLVEGYGLPALEAQSLGTPVLCSDIEVFKEVLDSSTVFLPPKSSDLWVIEIRRRLAEGHCARTRKPAPRWSSHFETVLGERPAT